MRVTLIAHGARAAGGLMCSLNFVKSLNRTASNHQFLLVVAPDVGFEQIELPAGSEVYLYKQAGNKLRRLIFDNIELPKLVRRFNSDWVFGMGNIGLSRPPCMQAVLIQDAHLVYPWRVHNPKMVLTEKLTRLYQEYQLKKTLRNTDLIFCQTPMMRERFIRKFRCHPEIVKILPNAISKVAKPINEKRVNSSVLPNQTQFTLFFLTRYYTHKNLEILIPLFTKYSEKLADVRCFITIEPYCRKAREFLDNIKKNSLGEKIVNIGTLSETELPVYYQLVDAVFLPTLLESFSGTYLEAMYFGKPILTSDFDFAHYVCGDAALYFDPFDPADISDKIVCLKDNNVLRQTLVNKGKDRTSGLFSNWDEVAGSAIKYMEQLMSQKRLL